MLTSIYISNDLQVKPRSALMPAEERKSAESPEQSPGKRRRRSPSPGARSPAYSDISDDTAPPEPAADADHRAPFPVYHQYYGQPPYMPAHAQPAHPAHAAHPAHPAHTAQPADKPKDDLIKNDPKTDLKVNNVILPSRMSLAFAEHQSSSFWLWDIVYLNIKRHL